MRINTMLGRGEGVFPQLVRSTRQSMAPSRFRIFQHRCIVRSSSRQRVSYNNAGYHRNGEEYHLIQTVRVATWSIILGFVTGLSILGVYYAERQDLAIAKCHLLERDYERASEAFDSLTSALWNRDEAQVGFALSNILGEGSSGIDFPDDSDIESGAFPYRLLLYQALMDGKYRACLRLAGLLAGLEKWTPLFEAAAYLELGDRVREDAVPEDLRGLWLGSRLQHVQNWLKTAPRRLIYDRKGRCLGLIRADGVFEWDASPKTLILPAAIVEGVQFQATTRASRLSVDMELSELALEALEGYRGSIVLVSTGTGDILAAVSDRNTNREFEMAALGQQKEPASISKLITATAAARAGLNADDLISQMSCHGAVRYRGGILYCPYRAGPLEGLNRAMAISCNIAFANLGVLVGRSAMLDELRLYGFDRLSSSDIQFGRTVVPHGNELQLANLSIGLEATSITPIHAALMAAVFGNQGVMPEPRLLTASDGLLGLSPLPIPPDEGHQVIDPSWLPSVLASMKAVTQPEGTAYGVSPPGFPLAMKTGTGRDKNQGFHTNYIGIGPMPNPKISFCIRITDQATSARVRRATRRVARRLFEALSKGPELLADPVGHRITAEGAENAGGFISGR
jgi:hypothetical protein